MGSGAGNSSLSTTSTSSVRRSKNLYAVKLAIQAQTKREQETIRLQREHKSQTTAERPTTLQFKQAQSAAERHAFKSLEVNKATIKAVVDKTHHRRSQSETIPPNKIRQNEIRPRYLEPKPQIQPLQTQNKEAVVSMSLSEDSSTKNSKLTLNKRLAITEASKSNMSRDSLSSPIKQVVTIGPQCTISTASEVDLSIDSLGGSMHSSIKSSRSNKSVSQESLIRFNATVRANNLSANRIRRPASNRLSSNEHSPASASTTTTASKSSRLSSINSTTGGGSTKDSTTSRRNTPQSTVPIRRSFVSAKSREILAAKHNAQDSGVTIKDAISGDNNASSATTSNKRSIIFPTTLHLRRTAKLHQVDTNSSPTNATVKSIKSLNPPNIPKQTTRSDQPQTTIKTKPSQDSVSKPTVRRIDKSVVSKVDAKTVTSSKISRIKGTVKNTVPILKKTPKDIDLSSLNVDDSPEFVPPPAATRVESKLERSSTFCKESPMVNMGTV